jgi:hypothetical protein
MLIRSNLTEIINFFKKINIIFDLIKNLNKIEVPQVYLSNRPKFSMGF